MTQKNTYENVTVVMVQEWSNRPKVLAVVYLIVLGGKIQKIKPTERYRLELDAPLGIIAVGSMGESLFNS